MYFRSYEAKADIAFNSVGAIQAHYNTSTLSNLRIPLPSVAEQKRVLEACRCDLAPVDTAISLLEREIDLLREYRTRLVADVVTGKLDVRAAAARLPEEVGSEGADNRAVGVEEESVEFGEELEP